MRKKITILLSTFLLLMAGLSAVMASGPAQHYNTMVYDITNLPNVTPIAGSSAHLVTNDQGATLQINTSDLQPGHALTVWWVIFNYPENCWGECGFDDAFPPPGNVAAGASVSFAAGNVVGNNGMASFAAHIPVGGDAAPWTVGLLEPDTAEFHFALRDHGPATPGILHEQISTAYGGCTNIPPFPGPYLCVDVQGGVFPRP